MTSRGEVSAQTVMILPALLLMLWVGVHIALLLHGSNVAAAVAEVVARRAASADGADYGELQDLADSTARDLSGALAEPIDVDYRAGIAVVSVTVRGPTIVPFLPAVVTRTSAAPIERFLTEEERR